MEIAGPLLEARLVARLNRFAALVNVGGREALAHVPNSGRMRELLFSGAEVLVAERSGTRKTCLDLLLVRHGPRLVGVDARVPPRLLEEKLLLQGVPELGPIDAVRREVRFGGSRLDLLATGPGGGCLIETKSVNLVVGGVALFPDAPTSRGARHLEELRRAAEAGRRAAVVFVVQRDDAEVLRPFERADPLFAATLRTVSNAVQILAYRCDVAAGAIRLADRIPVEL